MEPLEHWGQLQLIFKYCFKGIAGNEFRKLRNTPGLAQFSLIKTDSTDYAREFLYQLETRWSHFGRKN